MDRIGPERQHVVREIFRNLVTAQGTRAVVDREELLSAFPDRAAAEDVLRQLIDARLLTSYEVEGKEGEPSHHRVEVVHESLLKAWPRLVRWQTQDEDGALLRDQLKQAAHLWDEKGRTRDLLWTGTAYQEYALWRERYPGALTAVEEDFARSMADRARRTKRLVRSCRGRLRDRGSCGSGHRGERVAAEGGDGRATGRSQQAAGAGSAEAAGRPHRGARVRDSQPRAGRHERGTCARPERAPRGATGVGARPRDGGGARPRLLAGRTATGGCGASSGRGFGRTRTAARRSDCRTTSDKPASSERTQMGLGERSRDDGLRRLLAARCTSGRCRTVDTSGRSTLARRASGRWHRCAFSPKHRTVARPSSLVQAACARGCSPTVKPPS